MNEHSRKKLWILSLVKPLFRQELKKILEKSNKEERFELLIYCYYKYSDIHPDVLLEVFEHYKGNNPEKARGNMTANFSNSRPNF